MLMVYKLSMCLLLCYLILGTLIHVALSLPPLLSISLHALSLLDFSFGGTLGAVAMMGTLVDP